VKARIEKLEETPGGVEATVFIEDLGMPWEQPLKDGKTDQERLKIVEKNTIRNQNHAAHMIAMRSLRLGRCGLIQEPIKKEE